MSTVTGAIVWRFGGFGAWAACMPVLSLSAAGFLFLLGLSSFPLPPVVNCLVFAFLASALPVLAAIVATPPPCFRLICWTTALSLMALLLVFGAEWVPMLAPATGTGALTVWVVGGRRRWRGLVRHLTAGGLTAVFGGLLAACYLDWPASPQEVPAELSEFAAKHGVERFHAYALDTGERLWRIDANPESLQALVLGLGARPAETAPEQFWKMPPYYWPRRVSPGARLYATPSFPVAESGPPGDHYFLLVDGRRGRALVWVKSNPYRD